MSTRLLVPLPIVYHLCSYASIKWPTSMDRGFMAIMRFWSRVLDIMVIHSIDPFNGEIVGKALNCTRDDALAAIDAAKAAQPAWSQMEESVALHIHYDD